MCPSQAATSSRQPGKGGVWTVPHLYLVGLVRTTTHQQPVQLGAVVGAGEVVLVSSSQHSLDVLERRHLRNRCPVQSKRGHREVSVAPLRLLLILGRLPQPEELHLSGGAPTRLALKVCVTTKKDPSLAVDQSKVQQEKRHLPHAAYGGLARSAEPTYRRRPAKTQPSLYTVLSTQF